jgi:hypothetical protein
MLIRQVTEIAAEKVTYVITTFGEGFVNWREIVVESLPPTLREKYSDAAIGRESNIGELQAPDVNNVVLENRLTRVDRAI